MVLTGKNIFLTVVLLNNSLSQSISVFFLYKIRKSEYRTVIKYLNLKNNTSIQIKVEIKSAEISHHHLPT